MNPADVSGRHLTGRRLSAASGLGVAVTAVVALCAAATTRPTSTPSPRRVIAAAATATVTAANVAMPTLTSEERKALAQRFSPDRLAALRARLHADAQRAVRDNAEQGFREPTAAEAAALAGPSSDAAGTAVALAGGGAALKADAVSLEFVKVTIGKNGAVATREGKGARHDQ